MGKKSKKESTLYYFNSVGCAFCKQIDPIVEKLNKEGYNILSLDLSESDNQGLKREIENKYDLRCGTPFLVDGSNGKNICGQLQASEENIKKWADGEEIPEPPKPKSPAPPLPKDWDDKKQIDEFKKDYDKWKKENNHLPKLQTSEQIIQRFKEQWKNKKNQPQTLEGRLQIIETNLHKLMNHLGVK
tara:strand:+ start:104 stop:664 length:561 start_codon:yes stop_codon:yes gene_type:complete